MKFPTIHLNGTNGNDLLEQNLAVIHALRDLQTAMANAAPNGRDYYVQSAAALYEAQNEHMARLQKLADLVVDYTNLVDHISGQIDEHERLKTGAIRR